MDGSPPSRGRHSIKKEQNMSIIETNIQDGILTILLNRPEKLNALNQEVLEQLAESFTEAENNPQVKAILISGNGKAFCAGADIQKLAECDGLSGHEFACFGQRVLNQLENLTKPSLAAINGFAFGGGCELAMAATIRVAATTAQFGQPEVKLGVIPGYGGTQRLSRLVGKGRALDLCLTGRFIDAETANLWGLITGVYKPEELMHEARSRLQMILNMSPSAVNTTMKAIHQGFDLPLKEALNLEALYFAQTCATEDKQEGVSAFLEKRKAQFTGR